MPVFLPPSLSDEVAIVLVKDNTDGDVSEYFEDEDEKANEVSDPDEVEDGGGDELPGAGYSNSFSDVSSCGYLHSKHYFKK